MAMRMTLYINRHRQTGNMSGICIYVYCQSSIDSSPAHDSLAFIINALQNFFLQFRYPRIGISITQGTQQGFFSHQRCLFKGASQPYTNYHRGAWVGTGILDALYHIVDHAG